MIWRFTLDSTVITDPIGWEGMEVTLARDDNWHGLFAEYSVKTLKFFCDGYDIIRGYYETDGLDAQIPFLVEYSCNGEPFVVFFTGVVNVQDAKFTEGENLVECSIKEDSIAQLLRTRYDMPVSLMSLTTKDGSAITDYTNDRFPALIGNNDSGSILLREFIRSIPADSQIVEIIGRNNFFPPINSGYGITCGNLPAWNVANAYVEGQMVRVGAAPNIRYFIALITHPAPSPDPTTAPPEWEEVPLLVQPNESWAWVMCKLFQYGNINWNPLNRYVAIDPAREVPAGVGCSERNTTAWVSLVGNVVTNDTGIDQADINGMVAGYTRNQGDLYSEILGFPRNGEQTASPPASLYIAPATGLYDIEIDCCFTGRWLMMAVTTAEQCNNCADCGTGGSAPPRTYQNDYCVTRMNMFYKIGQNDPVDTGGIERVSPRAGNLPLNNLVDTPFAGFCPNISLTDVLLNEGDEIKLYFQFSTCGEYRRQALTSNVVHHVHILKLEDLTDCCLRVVAKTFFENPADAVIPVFPVYETGDRIVQSITDNGFRVQSDLLGRPTGQPYPTLLPGCAGHTVLTNGYYIRGFGYDGVNPPPGLECNAAQDLQILFRDIFLSLKDYFEQLDAIYCIGMGLEINGGQPVVRIEERQYFYPSTAPLISINATDAIVLEELRRVDLNRVYNQVEVGYSKWQSGGLNGLNEFNTIRNWKTPLRTVGRQLRKACQWVASGYAFEVTRVKHITVSATDDSDYDESIFVMQANEIEGQPVLTTLERGVGGVPGNLLLPSDQLNWRLRPGNIIRRWLGWIVQSFFHNPTIAGFLELTRGENNFVAQGADVVGDLPAGCAYPQADEDAPIQGADIYMRPELIELTIPISLYEYEQIRANPTDQIELVFVSGPLLCWVKKLEYNPTTQIAKLILIPEY